MFLSLLFSVSFFALFLLLCLLPFLSFPGRNSAFKSGGHSEKGTFFCTIGASKLEHTHDKMNNNMGALTR